MNDIMQSVKKKMLKKEKGKRAFFFTWNVLQFFFE